LHLNAPWRPVLDEPARTRALEVVAAVAEAIGPAPHSGSHGPRAPEPGPPAGEDASLAGGTAGLAIFYGALSRTAWRTRGARIARQYLDHAARAVAAAPMPLALYSGVAGIAWAIAHLDGEGLLAAGYSTDEIDAAVERLLRRPRWRADYDLVSGLVGFGVYALERLPARSAVRSLEAIVDRLDETSTRRGGGLAWHTSVRLLWPPQRQDSPRGYFNLGVAHGVPGVIALLGAICAAGIRPRKARRLLDGAVAWLRAQRRPPGSGSQFPAWIAPGRTPEDCRAAWCYGDPGIAIALFDAARSVHEPDWECEALDIARSVADRPLDRCGVVDAGLCHGAAGLGHIFNRFYQATGDETFAKAARIWFDRTLALRQPDRGVAGYATLTSAKDGTPRWHDERGLLTGAAGIALALLSAATPLAAAWDRMLLVSTRHLVRPSPV
jgi:lantibiotic modifying enzyme